MHDLICGYTVLLLQRRFLEPGDWGGHLHETAHPLLMVNQAYKYMGPNPSFTYDSCFPLAHDPF